METEHYLTSGGLMFQLRCEERKVKLKGKKLRGKKLRGKKLRGK